MKEKNEQLISFLNLTKNILTGSRIAQEKTVKEEKLKNSCHSLSRVDASSMF